MVKTARHRLMLVGALVLATFGLSVAFWSRPRGYEKQLVFAVTPIWSPLLSLAVMDANRAGLLAADCFQRARLEGAAVTARYDAANLQVVVTLHASDGERLKNRAAELLAQVETPFGRGLAPAVHNALAVLERRLRQQERIVAELRQRKADAASRPDAGEMGLSALYDRCLLQVASLRFEKEHMAESSNGRWLLDSSMPPLSLVGESDARVIVTRLRAVTLAIMSVFLMALIVAILRDQIASFRGE